MEKYKILSIEVDGQIYDLRKEKAEAIVIEKLYPITGLKTKECSHCGVVKPVEHFNKDYSQKDKLQGWCKECKKDYAKLYQKVLLKRKKKRLYMKDYNQRKKEKQMEQPEHKVLEPQMIKPDVPIIDGSDPKSLPVVSLPESIDERNADSVIKDPKMRKNLWNSVFRSD